MGDKPEGRRVDYARTVTGDAGDPVRPCCDEARQSGAGMLALPSFRFGEAGEFVECGYAIEPKASPCACAAAWMPFDWRRGHAQFGHASQA